MKKFEEMSLQMRVKKVIEAMQFLEEFRPGVEFTTAISDGAVRVRSNIHNVSVWIHAEDTAREIADKIRKYA